tara:strand:- start:925 stop:1353 length:429 start_codon:yes stop_codon:yes gene_type:complete
MHSLNTIKEQNKSLFIDIKIGQNIGTKPMPQISWLTFKGEVLKLANEYNTIQPNLILKDGAEGVGSWVVDGYAVSEKNYTLGFPTLQANIKAIEKRLVKLCDDFEQDAIALHKITKDKTDINLVWNNGKVTLEQTYFHKGGK